MSDMRKQSHVRPDGGGEDCGTRGQGKCLTEGAIFDNEAIDDAAEGSVDAEERDTREADAHCPHPTRVPPSHGSSLPYQGATYCRLGSGCRHLAADGVGARVRTYREVRSARRVTADSTAGPSVDGRSGRSVTAPRSPATAPASRLPSTAREPARCGGRSPR